MNKTKVSKGKSNALKVLKNETLLKDWQVTTIKKESESQLPELLIITSFPPRECGIATYSQDLKKTISDKFGDAIAVKICALENKEIAAQYPEDVKYKLNTSNKDHYKSLAIEINADNRVLIVFLQHEFGLFSGNNGDHILELLTHLKKPVATTFHTILPNPDKALRDTVRSIAKLSDAIIVMTKNSKTILVNEYGIAAKKIKVVPHGTHLIKPNDTNVKSKVHLGDRLVLSTFGLISEGKNIETALEALPKIIKQFPNVLYLVIGKTHLEVLKNEGEKYRDELYETVLRLQLQNNVKFINKYLSLEDLIEYLQRTDIYLFTSKNPKQAVSGSLA